LKTAHWIDYHSTPTGPFTWVRDSYVKHRYTEVLTPVRYSYQIDVPRYGKTVHIPSSWSSPVEIEVSRLRSVVPSSQYVTVYNYYAIIDRTNLPTSVG